ncbi:hypothetical protein TNCV_2901881, partial [Trichonephila clavipes]
QVRTKVLQYLRETVPVHFAEIPRPLFLRGGHLNNREGSENRKVITNSGIKNFPVSIICRSIGQQQKCQEPTLMSFVFET